MNRWVRIVCVACVLAIDGYASCCFAQKTDSMFTSNRNESGQSARPRRPLSEDEMVELRRRELLQDFDEETSLDHGESIHPRLMQSVKDNTVGVRYEEREAYLRILRLASEVPLRKQQRFADQIQTERRELNPNYKRRRLEDFPQFVDLFAHPEFYRGRPVTMRGVMRRLTKFDVGKNSLDLDQAYEGWVYTPDSQGNPVVVVFTSKDERLPVNGDMQEEVEFTGYYFKMYGYDAEDTTRKAPLLIAGEVQWTPHPYTPVYHPRRLRWYVATMFVFMLGCYLVWQTNRREMPPRPLAQVEPDFTHFPPRIHPAPDPHLPHLMTEPEDS